jgi:MFS family permease
LAVLCAMQLMIILDGTVVTVALPTIQSDLGFSQAGLAWVMNAYLIAFAGLLLLAGRFGDLIGGKRIFLAGLSVFTAASLLCGLAGSSELLIAGRFAQGVGGALASAVILGMIVGLFPAPGEQARAMGVYSFTAASGAAIGLIVGGVITQTVGWHWAFLINVPIGLTALVLATRLLVADRGIGLGKGADVLGAVLVTAGLSLGVYAIVQTAEPTAETVRTIVLAAVALLLLAAFVVRQARAAHPLLALRIFRDRRLAVASGGQRHRGAAGGPCRLPGGAVAAQPGAGRWNLSGERGSRAGSDGHRYGCGDPVDDHAGDVRGRGR